MQEEKIKIDDAPRIAGLAFRHLRGPSDYPSIVSAIEASQKADRLETTTTVESLARRLEHPFNMDPSNDMLIAEVDGRIIGSALAWWMDDPKDKRFYMFSSNLVPDWRGKGIRHCMLRYCERRLSETAKEHTTDRKRYFRAFARDTEEHWRKVLEDEGYKVLLYSFKMVHTDLTNVRDLPLPEGVEIKSAREEDVKLFFAAWNEATREMNDAPRLADEMIEQMKMDPSWNPSLWQLAWHNGKVIGTVMVVIDSVENEKHNRKRGVTELISIARPWRSKGIAKAMIARALRILKEKGMNEATLGVDANNASGALALYERMGYKRIECLTSYWKEMV